VLEKDLDILILDLRRSLFMNFISKSTLVILIWSAIAVGNILALTNEYNYQVYGVVPEHKPNIKIDGNLNEKVWSVVPIMGEFHFIKETDSRTKERQTLARVFYTKKAIYISIECLETDVGGIKRNIKDNTENAYWFDDCLEIYLETGRTYKKFHKLVVNPNGVLWAAKVQNDDSDATWQARSGIKSAATVGVKSWSVELRIPYAGFTKKPAPGDLWTFNIRRIRWGKKKRLEDSSWSPGATYNNPWRFGHLYFESAPGVLDVNKIMVLSKRRNNATIEVMLGDSRLFLEGNRAIINRELQKMKKLISTLKLEFNTLRNDTKSAKERAEINAEYLKLKKIAGKGEIDSKTMALIISPLKSLRYRANSLLWNMKWRKMAK
jgi:hypothetical protein